MPIDLSALGQIGSAAAGTVPLAQQRWAAAQQAQQEAEAQRRELAAQQIFGSLGPDMPDLTQLPGGQPPQAPAPGQSSQPMTMNQAFAPSAATGSPGPTTAVAPSSPPGAFPGAGPSATPVGTGTTGQPQGGQPPGLGALEQYIRQRNPGAGPAEVGMAALKIWQTMAPLQQQRLAMQEQAQRDRLYAQMYGINQRAQTAQAQIVSREQIAQMNDETRRALRAASVTAAKETPAERAQHAYLTGQVSNLQGNINAIYLQNSSDPRLPGMYQQLAALRDQVNQFNAGVAARLGGGGGGAPAATGAPAAGGGGPAVGTVEQGYRFRGGNPADQSSWEKVQ